MSGSVRISEIGTLKGHDIHKSVYGLIYFPSPHNIIVTSSSDTRVILWNSKTYEPIKIIEEHEDWVYDIIRWNETTFLSSCFDGLVKMFSILPPYSLVKTIPLSSGWIYQMMKIDDDRILVNSRPIENCQSRFPRNKEIDSLVVYSFSKDVVTKKFELYPSDCTKLVLSKFHENCFYVNCRESSIQMDFSTYNLLSQTSDDTNIKGHLANFETMEILKVFEDESEEDGHIIPNEIVCINVIQNPKSGQEIVKILLFDSESGDTLNEIEFKSTEGLYTISPLDSQYLLVGGGTGNIHIVDLTIMKLSNEKKEELHSQKILEDAIVEEICLLSSSGDEVVIAVCGGVNEVKILKIEGLRLLSVDHEMDKMDKMSRTSFLREYLFSLQDLESEIEKIETKLFIVKVQQEVLLEFYKSIFL